MANITLEDLNGAHYLGTQEGEYLRRYDANLVAFWNGFHGAANPNVRVNMTLAQAELFLRLNVTVIQQNNPQIAPADATIIAYHRLLAVAEGLISHQFQAPNHHVDYVETISVQDNVRDAFNDANRAPTMANINAVLTNDVKAHINQTFVDRVCLVAFVFRARGHHYMDAYEALYNNVWRKCRYDVNWLHISFKNLATIGLHAIFPDVLEEFWAHSVQNHYTNGALAKRFDCAPAGAAAAFVIRQGIIDLQMVAPGIADKLEEAMEYLDELFEQYRAHRYNGSVNARYYGAARVNVDEKKLAGIGATIYASLQGLAPDAPLGESPALKRIADQAPITGAVLAGAIRNISSRPEVTDVLLKIKNE